MSKFRISFVPCNLTRVIPLFRRTALLSVLSLFVFGCSEKKPAPRTRVLQVADSLEVVYKEKNFTDFCDALMKYKLIGEEATFRADKKFGEGNYPKERNAYFDSIYDELEKEFNKTYNVTSAQVLKDNQLLVVELGYPCAQMTTIMRNHEMSKFE